jgi:hypothetical protein
MAAIFFYLRTFAFVMLEASFHRLCERILREC